MLPQNLSYLGVEQIIHREQSETLYYGFALVADQPCLVHHYQKDHREKDYRVQQDVCYPGVLAYYVRVRTYTHVVLKVSDQVVEGSTGVADLHEDRVCGSRTENVSQLTYL